jgi:alanine-glyoxylate transaminase/serine-glyoxylate transaminase/serine-pyruvate transaminase
VAVVHAETSTGVANPVGEIGELVEPTGALYLVDTVTSLGGMPVTTDDVAGGRDLQRNAEMPVLSARLGARSVSRRAPSTNSRTRQSKVPNWYSGSDDDRQLLGGREASLPSHGPDQHAVRAVPSALHCILEEGLAAVFARHQQMHEYLVSQLESLGLSLLVDKSCRLPMLNAVCIP